MIVVPRTQIVDRAFRAWVPSFRRYDENVRLPRTCAGWQNVRCWARTAQLDRGGGGKLTRVDFAPFAFPMVDAFGGQKYCSVTRPIGKRLIN